VRTLKERAFDSRRLTDGPYLAASSPLQTANDTNHPLTLPSTIVEGDLIVAYWSWSDAFVAITDPANMWRILWGRVSGGGNPNAAMFTAVADGSEGGTTKTLVTASAVPSSTGCVVIRNWVGVAGSKQFIGNSASPPLPPLPGPVEGVSTANAKMMMAPTGRLMAVAWDARGADTTWTGFPPSLDLYRESTVRSAVAVGMYAPTGAPDGMPSYPTETFTASAAAWNALGLVLVG